MIEKRQAVETIFICPVCHGNLQPASSLQPWAKSEPDYLCGACDRRFPLVDNVYFFLDLISYNDMTDNPKQFDTIKSRLRSKLSLDEVAEVFDRIPSPTLTYTDLILESISRDCDKVKRYYESDPDFAAGIKWNEKVQPVVDYVAETAVRVSNRYDLIAEVCAGDGEASVSIANHLTCGVTVVTADKGEEKCHAYWRQQKLGNEAATLYCIASDVRELPFKNEDVDIVVDMNGLMHVFHADRAVAEISRILKPGGFVVASAFNVIPGSFRQKHGGISSIEQLVTLYEKNDISVITTECILKTDAGDPRATGLLFQKTGA